MTRLVRLWLTDFRCYDHVELELAEGCTVVTGSNGQGKTSLLEAITWLATGRSLRGVPDRVLVRAGAEEAIVRAEIAHEDREVLVEAAIRLQGRNRILANKQPVTRRRDLAEHLRVTVFAPDDLALVKGAPAGRRDFVDDLLVASAPRLAGVITDYERVLKQRNALLRAGIRNADDRTTRDVLDARLVASGAALIDARLELIAQLTPAARDAYASLAGDAPGFATAYDAEWSERAITRGTVEDAMRDALARLARREEDRGLTLVGPHRDDWTFVLDGMDARHHASQGEQRTLALALRLAGHEVVAGVVGEQPLLLLDDVFSELDARRAAALVAHLPATQTLVTTAGALPEGIAAAAWLRIEAGRVVG
jgi:DNA replication and repair protein RecF